jgi:type IV secretory pathway VirB3-like protein
MKKDIYRATFLTFILAGIVFLIEMSLIVGAIVLVLHFALKFW